MARQIIRGFFSTPIPEKVWHYTSVDALEGILLSQKIFATEAHHTTDPNEFTHARTVAADYLARTKPFNRATRIFRDSGRELLDVAFGQDGTLSAEHHEIFIVSFSGSADKRSQWESYAQGATGVSIAFDLRDIRPPLDMDSGISFAPCIYQDRDKELLLEEALRFWTDVREELLRQSEDREALKQWLNNQRAVDRCFGTASSRKELFERKKADFEKLVRAALHKASFELLRVASHCKEGKYIDEDEWRLALPHRAGKPFKHNEVRFRGPENIPYVAHNLFNFGLPITEIMLGTRCTYLTRIRTLLQNRRLEVPITLSQLEYPRY